MSVKTLPDGNVLVSIPPGYGTNQITSEIYGQRVYEQIKALAPGMTVLDVGASIGIFSLKASKIVGQTGRVIAIEPDPESFAALQDNIAANNASNVTAVNVAAWNSYATLEFNNSVKPTSRYTVETQNITVQAEPLDCVLKSLSVNHVDFLKIDIEGSELQALQGLSAALDDTYYVAIAAYHRLLGSNKENKEDPNEIAQLLKNKGLQTTILRYYFGIVPYVYAVKD